MSDEKITLTDQDVRYLAKAITSRPVIWQINPAGTPNGWICMFCFAELEDNSMQRNDGARVVHERHCVVLKCEEILKAYEIRRG